MEVAEARVLEEAMESVERPEVGVGAVRMNNDYEISA